MSEDVYTRVISSEEEHEGYFMVLKDSLSFFPLPGKPFELKMGTHVRGVCVKARHCECRGPDKPHDHYLVQWAHLKKGDRILIRKDGSKAARYVLQVRSEIAQQALCG